MLSEIISKNHSFNRQTTIGITIDVIKGNNDVYCHTIGIVWQRITYELNEAESEVWPKTEKMGNVEKHGKPHPFATMTTILFSRLVSPKRT